MSGTDDEGPGELREVRCIPCGDTGDAGTSSTAEPPRGKRNLGDVLLDVREMESLTPERIVNDFTPSVHMGDGRDDTQKRSPAKGSEGPTARGISGLSRVSFADIGLDAISLKSLLDGGSIDERELIMNLLNEEKLDRKTILTDTDIQPSSSLKLTFSQEVQTSLDCKYPTVLSQHAMDFIRHVRNSPLPKEIQTYMILLKVKPSLWKYEGTRDTENDDEDSRDSVYSPDV